MTIAEKLTTIAENEKQVYFSGRQDASEEFWDSITNYGARTEYPQAFREWGGEYFRPTRKITPTASSSADRFLYKSPNIKRVERAYLDFSQKPRGASNQYSYYYTFYSCPELEVIEDIGMQPDYTYYATFSSCPKLRKVAKVRCDENTKFYETFAWCTALESVYFEGIIGQNGLNLQWSTKLTHESLMSIINALADKSGDTSGTAWVVKIGVTNMDKLDELEIGKAYEKGWNIE